MINLTSDSKIFVFCPADCVTGGTELLHQLVSQLRENSLDACIYYHNAPSASIPAPFRKYNLEKTEIIEDSKKHIVVLPEVLFNYTLTLKNARLILWWLSIDNFFFQSTHFLDLSDIWKYNKKAFKREAARRLFWLLKKRKNLFKNTLSLKKLSQLNALNLYQSEYAQNFLQNNNFKQLLPLKDYINTEFLSQPDSPVRKDQVLYNPQKGLRFTQELIARSPGIKWIALKNLTRGELVAFMRESKLYIDFGNHPGKDRLPREAAINGCCILTGMQGAAAFYEDIAIESQYKFEESKSSQKQIIRAIKDTFDNYENRTKDFDFYRSRILQEKKEFENQIKEIFLPGTDCRPPLEH